MAQLRKFKKDDDYIAAALRHIISNDDRHMGIKAFGKDGVAVAKYNIKVNNGFKAYFVKENRSL